MFNSPEILFYLSVHSQELGVRHEPTCMSFAVSLQERTVEWSSNNPIATPANLLKPRYYTFLRDLLRFNSEAPKLLERPEPSGLTLGEYLLQEGYSQAFQDLFLIPMVGAVWSATSEDVLGFPAETLIRFFVNHHLL